MTSNTYLSDDALDLLSSIHLEYLLEEVYITIFPLSFHLFSRRRPRPAVVVFSLKKKLLWT